MLVLGLVVLYVNELLHQPPSDPGGWQEGLPGLSLVRDAWEPEPRATGTGPARALQG